MIVSQCWSLPRFREKPTLRGRTGAVVGAKNLAEIEESGGAEPRKGRLELSADGEKSLGRMDVMTYRRGGLGPAGWGLARLWRSRVWSLAWALPDPHGWRGLVWLAGPPGRRPTSAPACPRSRGCPVPRRRCLGCIGIPEPNEDGARGRHRPPPRRWRTPVDCLSVLHLEPILAGDGGSVEVPACATAAGFGWWQRRSASTSSPRKCPAWTPGRRTGTSGGGS